MIFNINLGTFGGTMKNGDLVALCNVVEYVRKSHKNAKFYMTQGTIDDSPHCVKFFNYLNTTTDYFSLIRGDVNLNWTRVNLWDFRDISGDLLKIENKHKKVKKIVILPVFDAPYNQYRNWPTNVLYDIVSRFDSDDKFIEYDKIICTKTPLNISGWIDSCDFDENLRHILECEVFIGGETGLSIFASVLNPPPENLIYYYSSRALIHTTPFNLLNGVGELKTYWLNMEGTTWAN